VDRRRELAATVVTGKDGWLFHRDDFVVEQVAGTRPLPEERVHKWRWLLEMRHHWVRARGAEYVFFVAPEKHVVYPDKVIDDFQISAHRPVEQILRSMRASTPAFELVYPALPLFEERARRDTYFKTDTHWNMLGAHLGYRALCSAVAKRNPLRVLEESDLDFDEREFDGDLALRLDPEPVSTGLFGTLRNPVAKVVGSNGVFSRGSLFVFENPDRTLPRAVMFRDSFANLLLPLMAESFSRLVAVSSLELYPELIESEKPDVVITEVAERLLNQPLPASPEGGVPDDLRAPAFDGLCKMSIADVAACHL
jgi:alginate O-acetyltransferase complex protein AlgJ